MNFTVSYWTSHFIGAAKSVTQPTVGKMKSNVKTSVQQLIETWDENNPQDLAEKIALRLTKNEPVKFGAGVTLLRRATRPLHFRVASQVIFKAQERGKDMGPNITAMIAHCGYRLQAPHVALEVLTAPWCRFWPTVKTFNWLLLYFYKEAERHALTTPITKKEEAQLPKEQKQGMKPISPAPTDEEKLKAEEKKLDKVLTADDPEFHPTYEKTLKTMHQYFKLTPNEETYSLMAGYHGIRGEFEQCDKLIAELTNRKWVVHPIVYSGKMLGLIRLGQPQEAIQFYEDVTKRTGTNGNKMRKCAIAAYLLLNDTENAYRALQTIKFLTKDFVFIHFGDPERVKVIQNLFERLQKETNTPLSEEIQKALLNPLSTSQSATESSSTEAEEAES